jgi:DNA-binding transcriptional ArsR family regulator
LKTSITKTTFVWQYLLSVPEATPGEISKKTKIARPTVSQAINVLLKLKKVERIGQGRTTSTREKIIYKNMNNLSKIQFTISDIQIGLGDHEYDKALALYQKGWVRR